MSWRSLHPEGLVYGIGVFGDHLLIADPRALRHVGEVADALSEMDTVRGALSVLESSDDVAEEVSGIFAHWLSTVDHLAAHSTDPDEFVWKVNDGDAAAALRLLPPDLLTEFEPVDPDGYPRYENALSEFGLNVPAPIIEMGETYDDMSGVTSLVWSPDALSAIQKWCEEHGIELREDPSAFARAL